jgi:hypothetical protein
VGAYLDAQEESRPHSRDTVERADEDTPSSASTPTCCSRGTPLGLLASLTTLAEVAT